MQNVFSWIFSMSKRLQRWTSVDESVVLCATLDNAATKTTEFNYIDSVYFRCFDSIEVI